MYWLYLIVFDCIWLYLIVFDCIWLYLIVLIRFQGPFLKTKLGTFVRVQVPEPGASLQWHRYQRVLVPAWGCPCCSNAIPSSPGRGHVLTCSCFIITSLFVSVTSEVQSQAKNTTQRKRYFDKLSSTLTVKICHISHEVINSYAIRMLTCILIHIYIYHIYLYIIVYDCVSIHTYSVPMRQQHFNQIPSGPFWSRNKYIFRPILEQIRKQAPRRLPFLFWVQGSKPRWLHADARSSRSIVNPLQFKPRIGPPQRNRWNYWERAEGTSRQTSRNLTVGCSIGSSNSPLTLNCPDLSRCICCQLHCPFTLQKVLGHFRTKLNQRSDKSNVDSREFRQTRSILRRIWLLHLNLSRHFSLANVWQKHPDVCQVVYKSLDS